GFDDLDETRYSLPTLSTVDPGRAEIAETAVRVLLERINATAPEAPREFLADFRVIERESSESREPVTVPGASEERGQES
ncbi:substrate-binding domain-containing protein, partial [Mucilaginibacter sp. 5C4]